MTTILTLLHAVADTIAVKNKSTSEIDLTTIVNTAISSLIAILVAVLPFWISKHKDRAIEYQNKKTLENFFWLLIEDTKTRAQAQVSSLQKCILALDPNESNQFLIELQSGFLFSDLKNIRLSDEIRSLLLNDRNIVSERSVVKLFSELEKLPKEINDIIDNTNQYEDTYKEKIKEINDIIDPLINDISNFINKYENNDDFKKNASEIIKMLQDSYSTNMNLNNLTNMFAVPMLLLCHNYRIREFDVGLIKINKLVSLIFISQKTYFEKINHRVDGINLIVKNISDAESEIKKGQIIKPRTWLYSN